MTGGKRSAAPYFEPTVLTDVTTDMVITKVETFGSVAPLYRFKTDDEAVVPAAKPFRLAQNVASTRLAAT